MKVNAEQPYQNKVLGYNANNESDRDIHCGCLNGMLHARVHATLQVEKLYQRLLIVLSTRTGHAMGK